MLVTPGSEMLKDKLIMTVFDAHEQNVDKQCSTW